MAAKLDIDLGTKVLLELVNRKDRINATFIGTDLDQYLVLKIPVTAGIRNSLIGGNQLTVRFLSKGQVVGFRSQVQEFLTKPYPLVFIDYPYEVEKHDLRAERRVDCNFPATISGGTREYAGLIKDISPSGCAVVFDQLGPEYAKSFPAGSDLTVTFHIFDKDRPYTAAGKVQSTFAYGGHLAAGLKFSKCSPELTRKIEDYVNSVIGALEA